VGTVRYAGSRQIRLWQLVHALTCPAGRSRTTSGGSFVHGKSAGDSSRFGQDLHVGSDGVAAMQHFRKSTNSRKFYNGVREKI
jgi:hypothetical protein